jgi:hypothetical protein
VLRFQSSAFCELRGNPGSVETFSNHLLFGYPRPHILLCLGQIEQSSGIV